MAAARAVRIPQPPGRGPPRASPSGDPARGNSAGRERAGRTAAIFSAALVAMYLGFVAAVVSSPEAGVRSDADLYGLFTALFLAILVGGLLLSLRRAPTSVERSEGFLVVRGRLGSGGSFPWDEGLSYHVVERYDAGFLASEPTEVVRVAHASGLAHTYLVTEGLLPTPPRAAAGSPSSHATGRA